MSAGARRMPPPDWITADVLAAVFAVLVMLMLDAVPGWAEPLRTWLAFSTWLFAALALHAVVQAATALRRRRWRATGVAVACAAGLVLATAATMLLAARLPVDDLHATLEDAPMQAAVAR